MPRYVFQIRRRWTEHQTVSVDGSSLEAARDALRGRLALELRPSGPLTSEPVSSTTISAAANAWRPALAAPQDDTVELERRRVLQAARTICSGGWTTDVHVPPDAPVESHPDSGYWVQVRVQVPDYASGVTNLPPDGDG
jgi:hypothetical protein